MKINRFVVLIVVALLVAGAIGAVIAGSTGIAAATSAGDGGTAIAGDALDRASAAALAFTGGGQVTGTEVGDEDGYYEVEVTLADGSQVDVHLDSHYNVLDASGDGSGEN